MWTRRNAIVATLALALTVAVGSGTHALQLTHWKLDETSGNIADDATAADGLSDEYDATLGSTTFNATTPGPVGGALYLKAADSHTFYADSDLKLGGNSGQSEVSFSFWINSPWDFSNGTAAYQQVIGQHTDWSNRISLIHRDGGGGTGYLAWDHRDRDGGYSDYRPGGTNMSAYADQWIQVAATYNAGSYKTYVNGEQVFSGSSSIPAITAATGDRPFGVADENPDGRDFVGSTFDDMGVWDNALDAAFVRALYQLGLPSSFENLSSSFGIGYNLSQVQELFDAHDAQSSVIISDTQAPWAFVTGLDSTFTGGALDGALFTNGDRTFLLISGGDGTGMERLPEPSTCVLLGMGLLGLALSARRRRRTNA